MTKIIAIANQKGGVGKTTTSVNLAASLAATRRNVLLIDMDPQGNATMGSGVDKHDLAATTFDVLLEMARPQEVMLKLDPAGFHIIPANADLTAAEVELLKTGAGQNSLRRALESVAEDFDFILIDCPPSLNMLTINALVAARSVMIPMQCEYYALEGLSALLNTIESIRASLNPELQIEGLVRTMFDPRNNLANDVTAQLTQHFGDKLYRTVIPRNIRLAEAPSHGLPVLLFDRQSRGAEAYLALAGEILRREMGETAPSATNTWSSQQVQ